MSEQDAGGGGAVKRDRSPAFPYLGLGKALERTQVLFDKVRRHEARVVDIAKDWGLTAKSSSLDRNVAALLLYGLISDSGSGEARKIRVSDVGLRILEDKRPGVREKLLAEAALKPKILQDYAQLWKGGRPDEAHSLSTLKFEGGFTDEGARMFLRVFDETIRFTMASEPDSVVDTKQRIETPGDENKNTGSPARIGDAIQWTVGGANQFAVPAKVVQVSDDNCWLWVEGSATGIPMEQTEVITRATPTPPAMPPIHSPMVSAHEREWLRGPLSKDTSYRLVIAGDMGPREIGKLIKLLQAQQAVLSDEPEET